MAMGSLLLLLLCATSASGAAMRSGMRSTTGSFNLQAASRFSPSLVMSKDGADRFNERAAAAAAVALAVGASPALAASSGGRIGGRAGGGGGYRGGGGGGGYGGGSRTNIIVAPPPVYSPFGFGGFGFSPFGFSPFGYGGFGLGFGLPLPLVLFALGGLALTSFRSSRGIEPEMMGDDPGAAYCIQLACYCGDREKSLYGRLQSLARTAETDTYEGLQQLVSDTCLAMLRSSNDWLAARTSTNLKGFFKNDVESQYNRIVVQERSKWESEQQQLSRTTSKAGQPTYMVVTLVVLLREGSELPAISGTPTLRDAIAQLAADVSVEDNLIAAEVLWTPEEDDDVMDRDDMFLNFPELITI
uniref:DUF1517 domain-containing protein n=1 Tax=Chrysotila carterae TaxID=13221 RepID=A0A6T0A215_CHRCT|mmetsp:Transcript_29460/g.64545  ORF Transcript_29460/g.64545 Transcript_29460/m.64545 type:complete len:358 (-) Transcript_29460:303-1376(-)